MTAQRLKLGGAALVALTLLTGPPRAWAQEAIAALAPLPEGVVKDSLTNFALAVLDRAS